MKIFLDSIGCRLNQAEIESYARHFHAAGHLLVADPQQADLAVVNTCAVTAQADSDSRQKIRQAARAGASQVIVTGCWATLQPQEAAALAGVRQVIPNRDKDCLVSDLLQIPPQVFDLEPLERQPGYGARLRTRAFVKVQDGCDNRCTFCVTTIARGPGRSRPAPEVLGDIHAHLLRDARQEIASGAAQEIVLSGVHLGSWGQDFSLPLHLQDLVKAILSETELPRLRLSSLEPWDLDAEFFDLWQNRRLCPQLHLPLQSGCAATLRRMARKTTPDSYARLLSAARAAIPEVAITTDLIAGFPGESEAEFEESLAYVKEMQFADGHVFTFSARPGTAAARMPGQVPLVQRKERNARLRAALADSAQAYKQRFIGQVLPVLWESAAGLGPGGWLMTGLTGNYLRVKALASRDLWNQITQVRLLSQENDHIMGEIVN